MPERQAADDRNAGRAQPATERVGDLRAVRAGSPCADEGDGRLAPERLERICAAQAEQHGRSIVELKEQLRIRAGVPADRGDLVTRERCPPAGAVEALEKRTRPPGARTGHRRDQLVVAERQQAAGPRPPLPEQARDARREVGQEEGAAQTGLAAVDHAATRCQPSSR